MVSTIYRTVQCENVKKVANLVFFYFLTHSISHRTRVILLLPFQIYFDVSCCLESLRCDSNILVHLRGPPLRGLHCEEREHCRGHVVVVELLPLPLAEGDLGRVVDVQVVEHKVLAPEREYNNSDVWPLDY